jgi:hypothetical protein
MRHVKTFVAFDIFLRRAATRAFAAFSARVLFIVCTVREEHKRRAHENRFVQVTAKNFTSGSGSMLRAILDDRNCGSAVPAILA